MSTDINVQFFSHLNGLNIGNNWGDMIRLLDTCLVNGLPFTSVTAASIDAQGDINLTLYSAHNSLLLQVVELTGFTPSEINGKYRIKGAPTSTQLILKAEHTGKTISTVGTAKLAALGYEIIFRDTNDVKRVYRAKNPQPEHPFIRVDETISDGVNSYNSAYAKSAMVGLLENMTHIDDYEDVAKLQLPLNTTDFTKNWKIAGTGDSVIRGWAKWYYSCGYNTPNNTNMESYPLNNGNRAFSLTGDFNAFYLQLNPANYNSNKLLMGCGLFDSILKSDIIPNWFLMATMKSTSASNGSGAECVPALQEGAMPLTTNQISNYFFAPTYNLLSRISDHSIAYGILPFSTGALNVYPSNSVSAMQIPFNTSDGYLRGSLKHVYFSGKNISTNIATTPILSESSMYIADSAHTFNDNNLIGGFYYYIGEMQ